METFVLIVAIIVAALSVYWYIRLMTKDNKSKKEIWLALLCFWGAFISRFIGSNAIVSFIAQLVKRIKNTQQQM